MTREEINILQDIAEKVRTIKRALNQESCKNEGVVSRQTGKWIKHDTGHSIYYDCSRCSCIAPCTETADKWLWKLSNYCPDCGAKMKSEAEELDNLEEMLEKLWNEV